MRCTFAVLVTAGLAACASPNTARPVVDAAATAQEAQRQQEYVLETRWNETVRLNRVSERLFRANRDLCPFKKSKIGLTAASLDDFDVKVRPAAAKVLGLSQTPRIILVSAGSPSEAAGLREGDEILAINGVEVGTGSKGTGRIRLELDKALEKDSAVALRLQRGVDTQILTVQPRAECGYEVQLVDSPEVNAYADGKGIFITRAIMKLATSDEELALVIAHELAHDTEGHVAGQRRNAVLGGLGGLTLDVLAAAAGVNTQGAFTNAGSSVGGGYASPEFEAEADYVGMYFMARAGYDTAGVEQFWRKMAVESPNAIFVSKSHPATPQRFLAIAATHKEIAAKQATSQPLIPNRRGK